MAQPTRSAIASTNRAPAGVSDSHEAIGGVSPLDKTMIVDVPCARMRRSASNTRASADMIRRPRPIARPSARSLEATIATWRRAHAELATRMDADAARRVAVAAKALEEE